MKPAYVRIMKDAVELTFDDGGVYRVSELDSGERQYALIYLDNVFGLTNLVEENDIIDAEVGVDQSLEDWSIATDAYRRNEESNDALLYADVESDLPAEYLATVAVSRRLSAALAGLFEELSYAR